MIDHDRRLRQFMARKDQERTEAHEEMEASRRRKSEFLQMHVLLQQSASSYYTHAQLLRRQMNGNRP